MSSFALPTPLKLTEAPLILSPLVFYLPNNTSLSSPLTHSSCQTLTAFLVIPPNTLRHADPPDKTSSSVAPGPSAALKNATYFTSHTQRLIANVVTSAKIAIAAFPNLTEEMKVLLQALSSLARVRGVSAHTHARARGVREESPRDGFSSNRRHLQVFRLIKPPLSHSLCALHHHGGRNTG